jgi:4-amino-4-deoxy-L-arabinose transferase-like glycosyltransferase
MLRSDQSPLLTLMNVPGQRISLRNQLLLVIVAAITFLGGCISPPHLQDDVDGTQGQIAKTMLQTGDWVTARLDGVIYLEKAPLKYWITAVLYSILGVHDWVARMPSALAVIALCLLVYRMCAWAGNERAGFYAGLCIATSIGLFLFTRIVIPDVILTLAIALAVWSFLRTVEDESPSPRWIYLFYAAIGTGVLLKGLIGIVFPVGICFFYLLARRQLLNREIWRRLHVIRGILIFLVVAAPWHILAILQNPPVFDFTLHADPHFGGKFRGFFWFYFINDQLLRFTNGRWPRDYDTVPRLWFWLYHIIWFFPWFFFLTGWRKLETGQDTRAKRLRTVCLIWILVVMGFFTLSTTQEYYSMPIYPALAILIGWAMTSESRKIPGVAKAVSVVTGLAAAACIFLLIRSWGLPATGDISDALTQNPDMYALALGHMTDLTFAAFAYLRVPLVMAAVAFLIGTAGLWLRKRVRIYAACVLMLMLFFQAARLALVTFDPYLSSYQIADALRRVPNAPVIFNGPYYSFSAVPFYTGIQPLILNGRINNLEYGSYAPDAPKVFIENADFVRIWSRPKRVYAITDIQNRHALEALVGKDHLIPIASGGGKQLLTNQPLPNSGSAPNPAS